MPTVTFSATGTGTGVRQDLDVVGSGHVIRSDAYESFGGKDEFPSPLAYALASLTTCNQVTASIVAKEQGFEIRSYAFSVDGDFNPTVMTTGRQADDDHPDTFTAVRLSAQVDTDASPEQVEALGAEVERRCPVSALYRRAGTALSSTWTVRTAATTAS
ncbi:OsmC family protein [Actinomycetospora sp.]|uniref:OsmC family protein n=1 Tax=Actinomycetospora sp. TaxID=1872135 RepID=UPI002F412868